MIEFNNTERIVVLFFLYEIMKADTIIHPAEESYMNKMLKQFKITTKDIDRMELLDYSYCEAVLQGFSQEKMAFAKECFVGMSTSDGYVDYREQNLIDRLCAAKG